MSRQDELDIQRRTDFMEYFFVQLDQLKSTLTFFVDKTDHYVGNINLPTSGLHGLCLSTATEANEVAKASVAYRVTLSRQLLHSPAYQSQEELCDLLTNKLPRTLTRLLTYTASDTSNITSLVPIIGLAEHHHDLLVSLAESLKSILTNLQSADEAFLYMEPTNVECLFLEQLSYYRNRFLSEDELPYSEKENIDNAIYDLNDDYRHNELVILYKRHPHNFSRLIDEYRANGYKEPDLVELYDYIVRHEALLVRKESKIVQSKPENTLDTEGLLIYLAPLHAGLPKASEIWKELIKEESIASFLCSSKNKTDVPSFNKYRVYNLLGFMREQNLYGDLKPVEMVSILDPDEDFGKFRSYLYSGISDPFLLKKIRNFFKSLS